MIEGVIFDWGGVLIDDPRPALMRYCAKALGVSEETYTKAHSKFMDDFQRGLLSEEQFWTKVCAELKRPKPKEQSLWGDAFRTAYSPRPQVFSLVSSLRKNGCKTALLSNAEVPAKQFFGELQYDMFDVAVFSCVEGIIKPDRKIYEITVAELGLRPEQTAFIDDRIENVNGAKDAGLIAILFRNVEQVRVELAQLGVEMD